MCCLIASFLKSMHTLGHEGDMPCWVLPCCWETKMRRRVGWDVRTVLRLSAETKDKILVLDCCYSSGF